MDVIATRRAEVTSGKTGADKNSTASASGETQAAAPKKKQKGKGTGGERGQKGASSSNQVEEEN